MNQSQFDSVTLDQLRSFVVVAEAGSFSAAGRRLGRAQSNISRTVAGLEQGWGVTLFDRSRRSAKLTRAGTNLLGDARKLVLGADLLSQRAQRKSDQREDEVSIVVDGIFPMAALVTLSKGFQQRFPEVTLKLRTENLGAVVDAIQNGNASIGVSSPVAERLTGLRRKCIGEVRMLPVCSRRHALARHRGSVGMATLHDEVQIVLSDRSTLTQGLELAVVSARTLSVADLGTKLELILAGLGWGNLPEHMIARPVAARKLVCIRPEAWGPHEHTLSLTRVVRSEFVPGSASKWLMKELERVCGH